MKDFLQRKWCHLPNSCLNPVWNLLCPKLQSMALFVFPYWPPFDRSISIHSLLSLSLGVSLFISLSLASSSRLPAERIQYRLICDSAIISMATDHGPGMSLCLHHRTVQEKRPLLNLSVSRFPPAVLAQTGTSTGVKGGTHESKAGLPAFSKCPQCRWNIHSPEHVPSCVCVHIHTHFFFWTFSHGTFSPLTGISFNAAAWNKSLGLQWQVGSAD